MKFASIISSTMAAAIFLISSTPSMVVCDNVEYFESPSPHAVYKPGQPIKFSIDDMPDHHGHVVRANLYKEDGNGMPITTFKIWQPSSLDDEDQYEVFDGVLDRSLPDGLYYVQIDVEGEFSKDRYRSYSFALNRQPGATFENTGLFSSKKNKRSSSVWLKNKLLARQQQ